MTNGTTDTGQAATVVNLLLLALGVVFVSVLVWLAGDILALFIVCFILAYLFDPATTWLTRRGLSRPAAAACITTALVLLLGLLVILMGPLVYEQLQAMVRELQSVFTRTMTQVRRELAPYFPALQQIGLGGLVKPTPTEPPVADIAMPLAASLASTIGLTLLAPVITFYLLKDWPRMKLWMLDEAPADKRPVLRYLARQIDIVLSAFLHGQAWVCVCCAALYTTGLVAFGLNYAIVVGVLSGALKFLPYIGTAIGFTIALTTGVTQAGWDSALIAGIVLTFAVTEFIESSFLSPRIIGNRVRLAPALVIFAVLLGGKLFGIIGIFIAIPVVAVGRVLLSFWWHNHRVEREPEEEPRPPQPFPMEQARAARSRHPFGNRPPPAPGPA